jgi:g-D-glutamyl-meso-diaminopimelate peptidase
MTEFTRGHNFKLVIAYHTQGEVIFWLYQGMTPPGAREYGEVFARSTGYQLADVPYEAAYAGYKDWFIEEFYRPGYTFEVGLGVNPLPIRQFDRVYNDNEEVMLLAPII